MAVMDTTHSHVAPAGILGLIYTKTVGTLAAWNNVRATRKALAQLTDRELEDIGLSRGDIDYVARHV